jgi:hypothetical protein
MNRISKTLVVALGLMLATAPSWANIRYVSASGAGQYVLPSQAVSGAAAGDTILIGPGIYNEGTISPGVRLTWIGAGWDQTIINATSQFQFGGTAVSGSTLEGIRYESSNFLFNIFGGCDSVTIRRCLIKSTGGTPCIYCQAGRVYVEDCILYQASNSNTIQVPANSGTLFRNCVFAFNQNSTQPAFQNTSGNAGTLEIYNCVFINYQRIFNLSVGALPTIAINNIFFDWGASPAFGTFAPTSIFDYNGSQTITAPGTNAINITANPFVNYNPANDFQEGISDFHLVIGSPLIHAGNPGFVNLDGSRSDLGIYGGPKPLVDLGVPNYPWTINVSLSPQIVGVGTPVNGTASGRVGPQY